MKKILVVLVVLLMSVPAFAFEVYKTDDMKFEFYGNLRFVGAYQNVSVTDKSNTPTIPFAMQGNSRYGFKFQISKLTGTIELATTGTEAGNTDGSRYRLMFATYAFENGGKLSIGKMALAGTDNNNDVWDGDNDMGGYGAFGTNRRAAVRYSIVGLDVSLISADADKKYVDITGKSKLSYEIPRIEIAYNLPKAIGGSVFANVLFANVNLNDKEDVMVTPFVFGVAVLPQIGDLTLSVNGFVGQGIEMFGNAANAISTTFAADKVKYAMTWGASIAPKYKINNALTAEVGFGYQSSTDDTDFDEEINAMAVYGQVVYSLNKYLSFTPQVGYYTVETKKKDLVNDKTDTVDKETLFVGVQARVKW